MTQPTEPGKEPQSNPQPQGETQGGNALGEFLPNWGGRRLRKVVLPAGGVLLAGTVGGLWWGTHWIKHNLAPLVAENLSRSLERPVNLGPLERFSLTGLRFGRSAIPPTPTDPDQVSLDAVEVSFDPIKILTTRDLNLDVTLVKPKLRLEQDAQGLWITTKIEEKKEDGPVKIVLKSLRFQDADISLVPTRKVGKGLASAIALAHANGRVDFGDRNQRFTYQLQGQASTGGQLDLSGETQAKPLQTTLRIKAQDMAVAEYRSPAQTAHQPTGGSSRWQSGDHHSAESNPAQFDGNRHRAPGHPGNSPRPHPPDPNCR